MNSIEQLKVAIGEPLKRKLGEQEFEFYPLEVPELINLQEGFNLLKADGTHTKESLTIFTELVLKMVKKAFPKEATDDMINQFVIKYFFPLHEISMELHSPDVEELTDTQKIRLEQLKQKVQKNVPS